MMSIQHRVGGAMAACALGLALIGMPARPWAQEGATVATPQTSSAAGVSVKVTPQALGATGLWRFQIVLDTHSADLGDDLLESVTLLTDDGRTLKPQAWDGAARPPPRGRAELCAAESPAACHRTQNASTG